MRGRPKKLVAVADLVARVLAKRHGHDQHQREAVALKVFNAFAKIGAPLTEHAEPLLYRNGILTLAITDSAWLTELTFLKPDILDRLNKGFSKIVVKDIRMRLGGLKKKRAVEAPPPPLSPEKQRELDAWGELISNEDVRDAVLRAASRSLASPKKTPRYVEGPAGPQPARIERPEPKEQKEPEVRDRWAADRDRWAKK